MKKIVFLFLINLILLHSGLMAQEDKKFIQKEQQKLEAALYNLPDVTFKKTSNSCELPLVYELKIRQPLDHNNPDKGYFYQSIILTHNGFDRPTIMQTQGYNMYMGKNELVYYLNANELNIEHRYFGKSVPDSIDYHYLNLFQECSDLHYVNQLFKKIYNNKWISTGISKGGQTTIFYKYYFPNDVDVAIPYVAPFNYGLEDERIYHFFDTIGTPDCRKKLLALQIFLLKNEDAAIEKLKWYSEGKTITYNYIGSLAKAYELTVMEYPFSFWQWGYSCNDIPQNQTLDSCLKHMLKVIDISFFGDKEINDMSSHYYQAATEMGYYGYNIAPLKPYIKQFTQNPLASFYPKIAGDVKFSDELIKKVNKFLDTEGNNMLYIYGGIDTWGSNRIIPSQNVNSKSFVLPTADHGKARIRNMSETMKQDFAKALKQMAGLELDYTKFK